MDSRVKALFAHLLKLLTKLKLVSHVNLRGLRDTEYMLHCTIDVKTYAAVQQLPQIPGVAVI
jgi:hypothetical protein